MGNILHLKIFVFVFFILSLIFPAAARATWYYPMDRYYERQTVKGFGDNINDEFYKSKENLFPYNRFYGYHAAVDLEVFPEEIEKDVPVYAVSSGIITYIGSLSGYGGVILEKLDNETDTAIYGHVKIEDLPFKAGDHITTETSPYILTYLGNQFSSETSKERKHLHFGIYRGTDLYFKGHENTTKQIGEKWYDPNDYLKDKNAIDPLLKLSPAIPIIGFNDNPEKEKSFLSLILDFFRKLLRSE